MMIKTSKEFRETLEGMEKKLIAGPVNELAYDYVMPTKLKDELLNALEEVEKEREIIGQQHVRISERHHGCIQIIHDQKKQLEEKDKEIERLKASLEYSRKTVDMAFKTLNGEPLYTIDEIEKAIKNNYFTEEDFLLENIKDELLKLKSAKPNDEGGK